MTLEYRGYVATVEYSVYDEVWHGSISNIDDCVTFESTDINRIGREFKEAVEDYMKTKGLVWQG